MKSYTDITQSKKLAEILPVESADMCWGIDDDTLTYSQYPYLIPYIKYTLKEFYLPCWSLAALLEVLPEHAIMPYYVPYLQKEDGKYHTAYGNDELLCEADNPIDACYEMILKLHKEKLI